MKTIVRFMVKLILTIIALHLVAICIVWAMNRFHIGSVDDAHVIYLQNNNRAIGMSQPIGHDILSEDASTTNLFLLGENHGVADVQKIDEDLFLMLHHNHGVRYYVAEMDSLLAAQLNEYLSKTKKMEEILNKVVSEIETTIPQQSSKELLQKWSGIYDYNRNLPDSLKIVVLGIDRNRNDLSRTISRDSVMFDNFVSQVKRRGLEKEKFYGLFGYAHVLQSTYGANAYKSFAAIAKNSQYDFANSVKSIVCYTLDSETYFPENEQFPTPPGQGTGLLNADGPITLVKGISNLKNVTKPNSITIFNLSGKNSPYRKNQDLAGVKVIFFGEDVLPSYPSQVTTDFFQYAILIRNSKASIPLDYQ